MTQQQIQETCKLTADLMGITVEHDNSDALKSALGSMVNALPTLVSAFASAKKTHIQKQAELLRTDEFKKMSITKAKILMDGDCFEELGWVIYTEEMISSLRKAIEAYRSILSHNKAEMEQHHMINIPNG